MGTPTSLELDCSADHSTFPIEFLGTDFKLGCSSTYDFTDKIEFPCGVDVPSCSVPKYMLDPPSSLPCSNSPLSEYETFGWIADMANQVNVLYSCITQEQVIFSLHIEISCTICIYILHTFSLLIFLQVKNVNALPRLTTEPDTTVSFECSSSLQFLPAGFHAQLYNDSEYFWCDEPSYYQCCKTNMFQELNNYSVSSQQTCDVTNDCTVLDEL